MAKGVMVVESAPAEGKEEEYNDWYSNTHIPEILSVPGFNWARRFKLHQPSEKPKYLAIYELEGETIDEPLAKLRAIETTKSDALGTSPPPLVTIYEEID